MTKLPLVTNSMKAKFDELGAQDEVEDVVIVGKYAHEASGLIFYAASYDGEGFEGYVDAEETLGKFTSTWDRFNEKDFNKLADEFDGHPVLRDATFKPCKASELGIEAPQPTRRFLDMMTVADNRNHQNLRPLDDDEEGLLEGLGVSLLCLGNLFVNGKQKDINDDCLMALQALDLLIAGQEAWTKGAAHDAEAAYKEMLSEDCGSSKYKLAARSAHYYDIHSEEKKTQRLLLRASVIINELASEIVEKEMV